MHHPRDRIAHTTAFATPVVEHWLEREMAQCVDLTTHHTMSVRYYHRATSRSFKQTGILEYYIWFYIFTEISEVGKDEKSYFRYAMDAWKLTGMKVYLCFVGS